MNKSKLKGKQKSKTVAEVSLSRGGDQVDATTPSHQPRVIYDDLVEKLRITQERLREKFYPPERPPSPTQNAQSDENYQRTAVMRKFEKDKPTIATKRVAVLKRTPPRSNKTGTADVATLDFSDMGNTTAEKRPQIREWSAAGFGPRLDEDGYVLEHTLLGDPVAFYHMALLRGDIEAEHVPQSILAELQSETGPSGLATGYAITYTSDCASSNLPEAQAAQSVEALAPALKSGVQPYSDQVIRSSGHRDDAALENWRIKVAEQRAVQTRLGALLRRHPADLVMNSVENRYPVRITRERMDGITPSMGSSGGSRLPNEFWNQCEFIGPEQSGDICITLTASQRNGPGSVEFISQPLSVQSEKGINSSHRTSHSIEHLSNCHASRSGALQPLISDSFSHEPETHKLEVVGQDYKKAMTMISEQTDTRRAAETSISGLLQAGSDNANVLMGEREKHGVSSETGLDESVYCEVSKNVGPSLSLQGQTVRWIDDVDREKCNPVEVTVAFETMDPRIQTKHLDLHNNGTTLIYYEWTRVPEVDSFHIDHSELRKFYFDFRPKVLKPGEKCCIPITFRSVREGIFKESWRLQTQPLLNAGSPVLVRLHGTSVWAEHHQFVSLRKVSPITEIEKEAAYRIAYSILNHLINQLRHPDPPATPIAMFRTEEVTFREQNPGLHYHHGVIRKLNNMYTELRAFLQEQTGDLASFDATFPEQWDLCLLTLRKLAYMAESARVASGTPNKRTDVAKLFEHVDTLSFPQVQPHPNRLTYKYQICYHHLMNAVLFCYEECNLIRNLHGLPAALLSTKLKGKGSSSSTSSTTSQARTAEINITSAEKPDENPSTNLHDEVEQSPDAAETLKVTPNSDAWRKKVTGLIYRHLVCMFNNMTACLNDADKSETVG